MLKAKLKNWEIHHRGDDDDSLDPRTYVYGVEKDGSEIGEITLYIHDDPDSVVKDLTDRIVFLDSTFGDNHESDDPYTEIALSFLATIQELFGEETNLEDADNFEEFDFEEQV
jgi:hypothetical protein